MKHNLTHILLGRYCCIILPILLMLSGSVYGQERQIQGVVTSDEGEQLPGVNILVKGTTTGTVTDIEGKYKLTVSQEATTLVFSSIGFTSQEVSIEGRTVIDMVMMPDIKSLSEVVVIGYGTQKKSHLTGAVSKVKNDNLDQIPISRVDDALVGQISGVNIQMTNPEAGEAPTITVRGQGSISSAAPPLVVVDGIVVGNDYLGSIDMNDVESIELLKDAASASIYGSRGANGVLMITTKRGEEGPTRFSYNGYFGVKSVPKTNVLSTVDKWASYVEQNNGELTDKMQYIQRLGTTTDWEEVMMDGGTIQNHSISASGGSKKTQFRASLNYQDDEGVLLTDNYKKINFRINLSTSINDRVEFGAVLNPSYTAQRRFPIGLHDVIRQSPWLPLYLDENSIQYVNRERENGRWADAQIGDYAMERMFDNYDLSAGAPVPSGGTSISTTSNQNPYAKVVEREYWKYYTKLFANSYLKINIVDGLDFRTSIGGDFRYRRNTYWDGIEASRNGASDSESRQDTGEEIHMVSENTLNFSKNIGKHDISALAGFTYEHWKGVDSDIRAAGYNFDYIQTIPATNVTSAEMLQSEESLVSFLSRVNYAYADKYLLSVSMRSDGSSKFGPDSKYGFFPAFSAGWRVSEEAFMVNNTTISNLKLRFSYGVTGSNNGIGRYAHIGLVEPVGAVLGGGVVPGFNIGNISNSELQWERLIEFNPGLDLGLFDDRIYLSVDAYRRTSEDLLLLQQIPSVTGFREALVNLGVVENEGLEVEVTSRNIVRQGLSWTTSANLTHNRNTLVDFAGANGLISTVDAKRPAEWIALEGNPISSFYGYVTDKEIDPQYIKDPYYPINSQSQDIYVKDLNGDGVIDPDDRTILGSPYPDIVWSVTNSFRFNQFDLSFMFQGSHGAEVRNIEGQYINNEFAGSQDFTSDFPNANLVQERIFTNDDIMDASYVALRNLNLGYTLPGKVNDAIGIQRARVYLGVQNLIYLMSDDYIGYNPEGINEGLESPLTYGYQRGAAPIYRTVSVGLNLEF